jgi:hypothetical protein
MADLLHPPHFEPSNAISVNHIVDRIARESELIIDELMPEPRWPVFELPPSGVVPDPLE